MPPLLWKKKDTSAEKSLATAELFPHGMTVLHQPLKTDVDIVFSLLPEEVPTIRVLRYGYDAYLVRKHGLVLSHRIRDHAVDLLNALASRREMDGAGERPIIFVAHSLGGIVCKDALLVAKRGPELHWQMISKSTRSIIFIATPHSGTALADMARIPVQILGLVRPVNSDLVSVLQTQSEVLERIQSDFLALVRSQAAVSTPLNINCFSESLPMPKVGIVVPKESATMLGYHCGSIGADHRDIVRYETAKDPGFVDVVSTLKRWISLDTGEVQRLLEAKSRFLHYLAWMSSAWMVDLSCVAL